MENNMRFARVLALLLFFRVAVAYGDGATCGKKHYIVYMGEHSHPSSESVIRANHEMLASVTASERVALHHYTKSFRGFSAMLTPNEAQQVAEKESVISVFESRTNELQTTYSWEFLGVNSISHLNHHSTDSKSSVIVGVIDSGIWPESESFNDEEMGPVPKKFKGECITGENFTLANCNRKIIGARYYSQGIEAQFGPLESSNSPFFRSARDTDGHGTHTASIIAGSVVHDVSSSGIARGTARGGVPNARLAIYKACWAIQCNDADILAALDDAIADGVDVISLSLGPPPPQPPYFRDAVSIGAFHAFKKGALVSAAAGNSAFPATATNVAPWILTVAASTLNRDFTSSIYLGNNKILEGVSLNPFEMGMSYGLVSGAAAAAPGVTPQNASFCKKNSMDPTVTKGKIVVCTTETLGDNRPEKSISVREAGGVGMILIDPSAKGVGFHFVIPSTIIGVKESQELQRYMTTERNPIARILQTVTVMSDEGAPEMAVFSSMGPNIITPDIIKPDITGPGVNILAAWPPALGNAEEDTSYNILSGTSMSCPHISAVAAMLRSSHPSWSPGAIMSAIMTTATILDNTQHLIRRDPNGTRATPFDYGSGHVNPTAALDPGLVYDFNSENVIDFLCSSGAGSGQLRNLAGKLTRCDKSHVAAYDLNYPSIGVSNMTGRLSIGRTVTYYGDGPSAYAAYVHHPPGVKVRVTPAKLKFTKSGENKAFRVHFTPLKNGNGKFVFGALTWSNGIHRARSAIAVNVILA